MSTIEVPYLPISNFDVSEIFEKFSETVPEEEEKVNKYLMTNKKDKFSKEILLILVGMGMEKYIDLFKKEQVLLETFLQLNETDLQELGITDPNDIDIIAQNLKVHQTQKKKPAVAENHIEDLKILRNISQQLLLMQSYCAYIELQMKKHKLTDYRIDKEETACMYLKAFTQAALIQSQKLNQAIYDAQDSLIDKILKTYNIVLPNALQKSLPKKKKKQTLFVFKFMTVIGFSSVFILSVKYFLSRS